MSSNVVEWSTKPLMHGKTNRQIVKTDCKICSNTYVCGKLSFASHEVYKTCKICKNNKQKHMAISTLVLIHGLPMASSEIPPPSRAPKTLKHNNKTKHRNACRRCIWLYSVHVSIVLLTIQNLFKPTSSPDESSLDDS